MADEEDVVLPAAEAVDPSGAARIRQEHGEIRGLATALAAAASAGEEIAATMQSLSRLLHDHVRYEERVFFMRLQAALPGDALESMGAALEAHRAARGVAAFCRVRSPPGLAMSSITALLGPTNTGKTYHAMERMLAHRTGMIGFPLRLLARENYDRLVLARGPEQVALVTGEERIVPRAPAYFVCTVEAMPLDRRVDFLAVDEIQLCADRERGHVFTDRLLHARGLEETMFLGAATVKPLLRMLVPDAAVVGRPRLSTLTYAPPRKIARLPRRTAIVVFSVADLYEVADRVRRETGGAALVFGALSPRTRNAQVALYQAGEVDYLVATDAIGMGLNLDIDHVAFTGLVKFDGTAPRPLRPAEVAQIAGRAGRHLRNGTFGATADLGPFDENLVASVESHRFDPLDALSWRNSDLSFALAARAPRQPRAPSARSPAPPHARCRRPPRPGRAGRRSRDRHPHALAGGGAAAVGRLPGPRLPQRAHRRPHPAARPDLPAPAEAERTPARGLGGVAGLRPRSRGGRHRYAARAHRPHPHVDLRLAPLLRGWPTRATGSSARARWRTASPTRCTRG